MKGALEVECLSLSLSLSLMELCERNMEGGGWLLYWGHWKICRGGLWRRTSLSIGAPLGNLEGGSYTGDFARWTKEGSRNGASLSEGRGTRREGSFTGDPEEYAT